MFHTHLFTPSERDPSILYCRCGETKDIHRHEWEPGETVSKTNLTNDKRYEIGKILRCKVCGELKEFRIGDL